MRKLSILLVLLFCTIQAENKILNYSLLTVTELAYVPIVDYYIHAKTTDGILDFSFEFIETEPYFEDKLFHFIAGEQLTRLNCTFLHPAYASALSLVTLTLLECRRYFSIRDEIANISGICFYFIKEYTNIPIEVRAGLKDINDLKIITYNYNKGKDLSEMYNLTEVEIIYKFDKFYCGAAISTVNKTTEYSFRVGKDIANIEILGNKFVINSIKLTLKE